MTPPNPDAASSPAQRVAVIGGGIIGLAVAFRVAQRGGGRVAVDLYERGDLAGEATRVAAGMLAPVSEADPAEPELLALGLESAALWPDFAGELASTVREEGGASVGVTGPTGGSQAGRAHDAEPLLRTDGTLLVARDADEGRWLQREAAIRAAAGLSCELLTPSQARKLEPDLAPGLRGALLVPGDLSVDPRRIAVALEIAARACGARLHPHIEIDGLDDPRLVASDRVVICSGAWPVPGAPAPASTHPVKGQVLVLRDPEHDGREEPIVTRTLRGHSVYFVPRGDGRYVVGATMEHRGYDRAVTAWAVHDLLRELFEVVPATREFVLEETIAGLRPATASGDPLIGPAPGDPAGREARVLYAVGHYRNGVLLAPVTAERIAALIVD